MPNIPEPSRKSRLIRQLDAIPSALKHIWLVWVALILGPFSLWFALLGKRRNRNQLENYPQRLVFLWFLVALTYSVLFFIPVSHPVLIGLYLGGVGLSTVLILRKGGLASFHFGPSLSADSEGESFKSLWQCWVAALIAVVPLAYLAGLGSNLLELRAFSIQWPGSVYIHALKWAFGSLPIAVFLGWLLWRSPLQPKVRTLVIFFVGLAVVVFWILLWETLDTQMLRLLWGGVREPLLFNPWIESHFRGGIKIFFYGSAGFLGIDYLILAGGIAPFLRRALFLGMPAGLAYAHMLFILGDWNYYLGALQATLLREQQLQGYATLAAAKAARVPNAFRTPYDLEELAEYHYQDGDTLGAKELWETMSVRLSDRPYAITLQQRANFFLSALAKSKTKSKSDSESVRLDLRLIKPATYLDADWYSLLSAIGFLRPLWSDLEIKKRLLTVSPQLQLELPALTGVPVLREVLDRLGIPHRIGFADGSRLKQAMRLGMVPLVNIGGSWTSIAGYDAARNAYSIFSYPEHYENNPWWGAPELDVLSGEKKDTVVLGKIKRSAQVPVEKSLPASELEKKLHDIGGVAVFLGDTAWISAHEDKAAFLAELGDGLYQEQDNDQAAAEAYAKAEALFPNDYIACRILYLKRRWQHRHMDPGDYTLLFLHPGLPSWARVLPLDSATVNRVTAKIWNGSMGQYLLLNWIPSIPPRGSDDHDARLDSAEHAFRILRNLEPGQALYLDSLASLADRRQAFDQEILFLDTLLRYHPFGYEDVQYRLAWASYRNGDLGRTQMALKRCTGYQHESRYELIAGATACRQGQKGYGRKLLEKSLKQNKSEPLIHEEWRRCQENDKAHSEYLKVWEERTR